MWFVISQSLLSFHGLVFVKSELKPVNIRCVLTGSQVSQLIARFLPLLGTRGRPGENVKNMSKEFL